MKFLVTGGAGFIGSWLCERLLERGEVVCLDNFDPYYSPRDKRKNIEPLIEHPDFKLVEGNILDRELLGSVFADVDYVFHDAAQAGVRVSVENPGKTHEVNATGTLNVLEVAEDCSVRKVINASLSSVYGNVSYLPFDEEHPNIPVLPYGASKLVSENYCRVFGELYDLETVSLRYFTVFVERYGRSTVGVFSSDHIMDTEAMETIVGAQELSHDYLVTFGVAPDSPHTGYGYIRPGAAIGNGYKVLGFEEKPGIEDAKRYVDYGYLWNSGMFLFDTGIFLAELAAHAPGFVDAFSSGGINEAYDAMPSVSIDYAIMEKSDKVVVVRLDYKWSDMGNFDALYREFDKNANANVVYDCEDVTINSSGNLIYSERNKLISMIDVDDMIVVDTQDALLVCPRASSQ